MLAELARGTLPATIPALEEVQRCLMCEVKDKLVQRLHMLGYAVEVATAEPAA
jgi:hypothetical protein